MFLIHVAFMNFTHDYFNELLRNKGQERNVSNVNMVLTDKVGDDDGTEVEGELDGECDGIDVVLSMMSLLSLLLLSDESCDSDDDVHPQFEGFINDDCNNKYVTPTTEYNNNMIHIINDILVIFIFCDLSSTRETFITLLVVGIF